MNSLISRFGTTSSTFEEQPGAELAERLMDASREVATEDSRHVGEAVNLTGSSQSFELAADAVAVEVLDAALQEPFLEAATLWCAVLESAHGTSQRDPVQRSPTTTGHPSFASRVWYLNSRLSSGSRQGEIAHMINAFAEAASRDAARDDLEPDHEEAVLATLAEIAGDEIRAVRPSVTAPLAGRVLERPLLAPERRQAKKLFVGRDGARAGR